jgi:hypothetical protein
MTDLDDMSPEDTALIRRDVRFALEILDECRSVGELANVMEQCLVGSASTDEVRVKLYAFANGLLSLNGSPVPAAASFRWGIA